MRVSILPEDPGYCPGLRTGAERYDVFLDGQPQEGVLTADDEDDEDGLVLAYIRDGDGGWRHHGGALLTTELRGAVEIVRR